PATIAFAATASDNAADGAMRKVEFFANGELIANLASAPFEAAWEGVSAGDYEIIAAVTDRHGQKVETTPVTITVSQGAGITLTAPAEDIAFAPGGTAKLAASVTQGDAAITKVEFFKNDKLIGADTDAPYELDWTEPEPGLYQITARSTDAKGGSAASGSIEAAVFDSAPFPALGLRLWLDGSGVTQDGGKVSAWADRTPFVNSISQADAGKQPTLHSEGANGQAALVFDGADDLLAATVNGAGLLSGDAASIFIVMRQAKASANNAVFGWESDSHRNHLGLLFTYNDQLLFDYGNASAGGRISAPQPERWDDLWNLVEVYRAGASGRVAVAGVTVFSGTFAGELDVEVEGALTLGGVGGLHYGGAIAEVLVYNRALSDEEIAQVRSVMATKFDLPVSANQEPTVVLTKPAAGTSLKAGKTLQLAASANDADGSVVKVRFLLGGQVIGEDTEVPYELEWTPAEAGEVQLSAVAIDDRDGQGTSAVVSVTVLPPNVGPEVVITSPNAGQGVSVGVTLKVSASATDSDGTVTRVEILADGESLAKRSEAPYEADWTLAKAGLQTVTVRATDNDGATSEASVSVAVYGDSPVPVDGLRLWLDAGEELTVSDAGVVSAWGDRSLFGHDVSQAELGLQPALAIDALNGKAAVLFDGTDDNLSRADVAGTSLLSSDAVSVYAVVRQSKK
ncbi:MAG TPA: hypothetical protein EYG44_04445, partial [Verrucomicrobia bacterium]|nr:hypothetical protein [Verrucomicrobiota bacterium]